MKSTKLSFLFALILAAFMLTGCPRNNAQTAAKVEEEEYNEEEYEDDGDDEWDDLDTTGVDYDYLDSESPEIDTTDTY